MKRKLSLALKISCLVLIVSSLIVSSILTTKSGSTIDVVENEMPDEENDFYVDELGNPEVHPVFRSKTPLLTSTYIEQVKNAENPDPINKDYETFPVLNNDTEYQALREFTYENINGKDVKAYSFFRVKSEAAHNPNVGAGLLIYHTIRYKLAHPEEDVHLAFTSYRISVTAAVCVVPESRYYGYMRALYDEDYDDYGFVTIGFMLVEAARLGIHVTVVGQLTSYGTKQYKEDGETLYKKPEPSYISYFNAALSADCYEEYEPGKKVSDFMRFKHVLWTLSDKGGADMMHLKSCISSHHLDEKGNEHRDTIWLTCSNLDTIDYRGSEAGNWSQSGVIVTDHYYLYTCAYNYIQLLHDYAGQGSIYEVRNIVAERNTRQLRMYLEGRYDEIPDNEKLLYLGSETDHIFEIYFTPLGGYSSVWDPVNNPVAKYTEAMAKSTEPVTYVFLNPRCETGWSFYQNLSAFVKKKLVDNRNPKNRFCIEAKDFDYSMFDGFKKGKDCEFGYFKFSGGTIHTKDSQYSYVDETGERQYVSVLSSCNFHSGAYYYQANSFLVIHEDENIDDRFFTSIGVAFSHKAVLDNQ